MLALMKSDKKPTTFAAGIVLALCMLLFAGPGAAEPTEKVDTTIQYLMKTVSGSGLTFIRNGNRATPEKAAEHMSRKYEHFRDDIDTPEDFIDLCATKSLLSGKPYMVVDGQGRERRTSDWLRAELAVYQEHNR